MPLAALGRQFRGLIQERRESAGLTQEAFGDAALSQRSSSDRALRMIQPIRYEYGADPKAAVACASEPIE